MFFIGKYHFLKMFLWKTLTSNNYYVSILWLDIIALIMLQ